MSATKEAENIKSAAQRPTGRPRGSPNKVSAEVRAMITEAVDVTAPKVSKWLEQTASRNPARAVALFTRLAEFVAPRLTAMHVETSTTDDGPPIPTMADWYESLEVVKRPADVAVAGDEDDDDDGSGTETVVDQYRRINDVLSGHQDVEAPRFDEPSTLRDPQAIAASDQSEEVTATPVAMPNGCMWSGRAAK